MAINHSQTIYSKKEEQLNAPYHPLRKRIPTNPVQIMESVVHVPNISGNESPILQESTAPVDQAKENNKSPASTNTTSWNLNRQKVMERINAASNTKNKTINGKPNKIAKREPPLKTPGLDDVAIVRSYGGMPFRRIKLAHKNLPEERNNIPQELSIGAFGFDSALPYLSQDCWAELVDNNRTFFLRPLENKFPKAKTLREFIRNQSHPINFIMNNQYAKSWPAEKDDKSYELFLNETNLNRVYVLNPRRIPDHPKVQPLPNGMKWQYMSTMLYGESKRDVKALFRNVSTSPDETKDLFHSENRSLTVWVRPMQTYDKKQLGGYDLENEALSSPRGSICPGLKQTAPASVVCEKSKVGPREYFEGLKQHRFVADPPGMGLDSHATWEALLAGCIPIIPKSTLDPMFENLPVWLIDDWKEVTDENIKLVSEKMKQQTFNWEKIFASGWKKEIYSGV